MDTAGVEAEEDMTAEFYAMFGSESLSRGAGTPDPKVAAAPLAGTRQPGRQQVTATSACHYFVTATPANGLQRVHTKGRRAERTTGLEQEKRRLAPTETDKPRRAHNPKVAGSNPAPATT